MDRLRLKELAGRLDAEIEKAETAASASKKAANEASGGLIASYSVAGDVEHAKNSALLSLQKVNQLKKLKDEIDGALKLETPEAVSPVCFVSVLFDNGKKSDFYFVKNPVYLSGVNLISSESLLGSAILGKKISEKFSYTAGDQNFSGIISGIS